MSYRTEVVDMDAAKAQYLAFLMRSTDRSKVRHCCSDLEFYRELGFDVDARPKEQRLRRRATKLRAAIPASFSVFRELMRGPAGATVVVLVPRTELPRTPDDVTVVDERELRAS